MVGVVHVTVLRHGSWMPDLATQLQAGELETGYGREDKVVVFDRRPVGPQHPRAVLEQDMAASPVLALHLDAICLDPAPGSVAGLIDGYVSILCVAGQIVSRCQAGYPSSEDGDLAWFRILGGAGAVGAVGGVRLGLVVGSGTGAPT
ncbi:putative protoporphyrinogen oxidase [Rosellinia necatrix]|uniref:Putative protoporphyrinogen oxidase n=1 Tax=Rosellinia necatrix TaxID=77044 RepID=A0A1S8A4Y2_ROSNE|nr:putative protoporphyrinogen oxidase [Rosellinia necatrix]